MARRNSNAGGVFVAVAPIAGMGVGFLFGMPTFGMLAGLVLGVILALAVWLFDRRSSGDRRR